MHKLLPEATIAETHQTYRSQAERDSLWLLSHILFGYTYGAVEADIVRGWLVLYPFGGLDAKADEKKTVIHNIVTGDHIYEDSDFGFSMQRILDHVLKVEEFRKQLVTYGLLDPPEDKNEDLGTPWILIGQDDRGSQSGWGRIPEGATSTSDAWTTGAVDYPGAPDPAEDWHANMPEGAIRTGEGYYVRADRRGMEQSPEEQALRRRRREAMVLGENGRPIQRRDIFEPNTVGLTEDDEDYDQESSTMRIVNENAVDMFIEIREDRDRSWWGWIRRLRPDGLAPLDIG